MCFAIHNWNKHFSRTVLHLCLLGWYSRVGTHILREKEKVDAFPQGGHICTIMLPFRLYYSVQKFWR